MKSAIPIISPAAKRFFGPRKKIFSGSAPGRLDVMGGIADYSGSLVLQMPIRETTTVLAARRPDQIIRIRSVIAEKAGLIPEIQFEGVQENPSDIHRLSRELLGDPKKSWAQYVAGCLFLLLMDYQVKSQGLDLWIDSRVPLGKGVSSSAAIEVATLRALCDVFKVKIPGPELAAAAQRVENEMVGAPCGPMDQLASALGKRNHLLPIVCQPNLVSSPVPIPRGIRVVGIDSGKTHAVSGASYGNVRAAAFMGYTIIARSLKTGKAELNKARLKNRRSPLPFKGYLANITPSQFETDFNPLLAEKMTGRVFSKKFGNTIDPLSEIKASTTYPVGPATAHPVYENHRVNLFRQLLETLPGQSAKKRFEALQTLGELMFQSHASYSKCGLGSEATDELVESVRKKGPASGMFGAKITGGGSGGTVAVLCNGKRGVENARALARHFGRKRKFNPVFFE